MTWTHDLALAAGLAVGLWLGAQTVGPLPASICIMLGILLFGAVQLGERIGELVVRAVRRLAPPSAEGRDAD